MGNTPSLSKFSCDTVTGKNAFHAFPIRRLIAMALHIPGEDANLIEVEGQAILGFGKHGQILRNFLLAILNLIEHEKSDNALAFRVLRNVERDVEIDHAGQHPSHAIVRVAHQPPIFDDREPACWLVLLLFQRYCRLACAERDVRAARRSLALSAVPRFKQRQLFAGGNLIEVFGVASRFDVQIRVIARRCPCACTGSFWLSAVSF